MRPDMLHRVAMVLGACALLGACGGSAPSKGSTLGHAGAGRAGAGYAAAQAGTGAGVAGMGAAVGLRAGSAQARLLDWPEFGLDPQRSDVSGLSTGITAGNVAHLRRLTVSLPGTVDSSAVYVHDASVAGGVHNAIVLTTTYGKTLALDADSGRTLWTFTPDGYSSWAGSAQITTTSPLLDPGRAFVYAASPDGEIHKLSLAGGREARGWPVSVTRDATHEKLAAALNLDGGDLLVATGGYFGDAPPYQGHVLEIDRSTGRIVGVFNTLCANRHTIIVPKSCPASDSAVLSRGGVVVERGGGRLLISTGNGPWNGRSDFGDSVIELTFPALRARQAFTPTDQAELNATDTDLGSSAPVLLGDDRTLIAGKDGVMRVLSLSRLDGRSPSLPDRLGGEVQRLPLPGGGQLFTAPAVWTAPSGSLGGGHTIVILGAEQATAAYALIAGRLRAVWQNDNPGTSPVMAGGLLYVYDPSEGGIDVYRPSSGTPIARLPGEPGHWNSPIVVDGHVIEPEGNANDHRLSGRLDIFIAG